MPSLFAGYRALFRHAGAARFAALSLVMRIPLGTVGLATLLHVRELTGSIAFAGSVVGAQLVAAASTAPLVGRIVDTRGPHGALLLTGLVAPLALATMLFAGRLGLSPGAIFAVALVAGAFSPPITVMVRTLWRMRLEDGPQRRTAFALDGVVLELAYTLGPLAIAAAVALASTTAAMGVAVAFTALAVPLLYASRALRWWKPAPPAQRHWLGPLTQTALLRIYAATFALTMTFGALEVGYPAFGRVVGADTWGPMLIAVNSIGSAVGGLVYGGLTLRTPLARQLPALMAVLAVPLAMHLPIGSPWVLLPLRVRRRRADRAGDDLGVAARLDARARRATRPRRSPGRRPRSSPASGAGMAVGGVLVERLRRERGVRARHRDGARRCGLIALSLRRA